jgi:hypothetical protein
VLTFVVLQAQYIFRTVLLLQKGLNQTDGQYSPLKDYGQKHYDFKQGSDYLFRGGCMMAFWLISLPFDIWFASIIGSYANEGLGFI